MGTYFKPYCYIAATYATWHNRLGHVGHQALEKMIQISKPSDFNCYTCDRTNRKERKPQLSSSTVLYTSKLKALEHIQMDILYHPLTRNTCKSSVIMIDMFSRYVYIAEIIEETTEHLIYILRNFIVNVQSKPKFITTDRAPCFSSNRFDEWLRTNSILLSFCSPNKHEGNAYAERVIQTLKNKAISLLNHSRLIDIFYFDAIDYATILYNRTYHSSISTTPFEKLHSSSLTVKDYDRFLTFGSTIFFENNGVGLFLGFCSRSTSGTIKILNSSKKIIRRNLLSIKWDETFMSRYLLPTLSDYFRSSNEFIEISQPLNPSEADLNCQGDDNNSVSNSTLPSEDNTNKNSQNISYLTIAKVQESFEDINLEIPDRLIDAIKHKDSTLWIEAAISEINKLRDFRTYNLVTRSKVPPGVKILPTRFVFNRKRDGRITARLVAGGHRQLTTLFGIYFGSPTSTSLSLKLFLLNCVQKEYIIIPVDFTGAYLNAILSKRIYLSLPKGFSNLNMFNENLILELNKSLYGLRESGRLWYESIAALLIKIGFKRSKFDPCIFYHTKEEICVLIYVDDCLFAGRNIDTINKSITIINRTYKLKRSELTDFFGFNIRQNYPKPLITISSSKYIYKCLEEIDLIDCKPCDTPAVKYDRFKEDPLTKQPFKEFLGRLLWINKFRPDISFAVHFLCCVANKASEKDWIALKRVFRYLKGSIDKVYFIRKNKGEVQTINVFTDASHQDLPKGHSTGSTFIFYGLSLIHQFSRKQTLISTSTYESEALEVVRATKEVLYIRGIMKELGNKPEETANIFTDCKILLHNVLTDLVSKRSKHFQTKIWFLKQNLGWNVIKLLKIPGDNNLADMGTKALDRIKFRKYSEIIFEEESLIAYLGRCDRIKQSSQPIKAPYEEDLNPDKTLVKYNEEYEKDEHFDIVQLLFNMQH